MISCDVADLIMGKQEKCDLTPEETQQFPHCGGKIGVSQACIYMIAIGQHTKTTLKDIAVLSHNGNLHS